MHLTYLVISRTNDLYACKPAELGPYLISALHFLKHWPREEEKSSVAKLTACILHLLPYQSASHNFTKVATNGISINGDHFGSSDLIQNKPLKYQRRNR